MFDSSVLAQVERTRVAVDDPRRCIMDLLADCSLEVTPKSAAGQGAIGELLPAGTRVYIAFIPGEDHREIVTTARHLRREGLTPVPHFPARSITDGATFEDYLTRLCGEAGVDEVLVIGGGLDQPVGAFSGTLALLETGAFERHGIHTIGLAGHPEGQRELPPPGAMATIEGKLAYAEQSSAAFRLVTQFSFEARPLLAWEGAIRAQGNGLPIHVGIPGPATIKALLRYARLCGVGNSMRMLTRQGGSLLRLASLSYPDALLTALAHHRIVDPDTRIERLHFYPFGGLARTAGWIGAIRAGQFTMHADGLGFTVDA